MATQNIKSGKSINDQSPTRINLNVRYGLALKRLFDLVLSGLGLFILSPVFCIISIGIKRESSGPVFYRGTRLGRGGKPFNILKFRSMRDCPESNAGPRITAKGDERITPLGRWLRDTKLNELPQLWNVFKGEMSLVGPRPEDPEIAKSWPRAVSLEILSVRPGITSPASVLYRHEEQLLKSGNVMDDYLRNIMPDKQRLDILYVRTRSFISDLDIIFLTLVSLFPSITETRIPENRFYSGFLNNLIRRYISWFVADFLIVFLASGFTGLIWRLSGPLDLGWGTAIGVAASLSLLFSLINSLLGLGRVSWRKASPHHVFDLVLSSGLSTILIFAINWFWTTKRLLPPGMVIEIGIFALIGFVVMRYRQRLITGLASRWLELRPQTGTMGERILIVGGGDCGQLAGWLLHKSNLASAINVVGMVDDDPHKRNMRIENYIVLGSTIDLPALVQRYNIGVILYAINRIAPSEEERILALCRSLPVRLVVIPDLIRILQDHLLPKELEESCDESPVE
jgi:lipopolysaccharide/colanic/teichoic acid biosynthesis glycosyltransferase